MAVRNHRVGAHVRAFAAVHAPADAGLLRLLEELGRTRAEWKVVPPDNLHLTLAFLGQVPEDAIPRLAAALDGAVQGVAPLSTRWRGVGAFPSPARPRILWAGVADPQPWRALAHRVRTALAGEGHAGDDKPFTPHLTLARAKGDARAADARAFLEAHADEELGAFTAREVCLYESRPGPGGPTYLQRHQAPLEA